MKYQIYGDTKYARINNQKINRILKKAGIEVYLWKGICNWSKKGNLYHFYFITKTDNPRNLKSASIYIGYDSITGHEERYAEEIKKQYSIIGENPSWLQGRAL